MAEAAFFNSRSTAKMRYSFPTLERKEILKLLADMGVQGLTEEHLMRPTMEVVCVIYENFVHCLMGIPKEELSQPVLGALENLRFEELYDDALGNLAFIRALTKLMHASGAMDFATRDIFKPDPSRTVHFLSAVINFAMFRSERALADVQEEKDALIMKIQQLAETSQQLERQISEKEAERKAEQPQVQALELETKELEQVISNLNKQQAALQSDIRVVKQELNSLVEKIASEKSSLAQIKQEGFQLRTQIVQSPGKLQKMLEDKKLALEHAEARVEAARQSVLKWQNKLKAYTKAKKKLQKCLNMIDDLEKHISLMKKMAKEFKDMKTKVKSNEERSWSISAQSEELKIEGQHFQDLMDRLNSTFSLKCEEADKELEDFKSQTAPSRIEHEEINKEISKKEVQLKQINVKAAEAVARKEACLKELREQVEFLRIEITRYNNELVAAIDAADLNIMF